MWFFTTVVFTKLPLYQYIPPVKIFFFVFALLFGKINVYVRNIIHHTVKAEVIQEMIAGKIRSVPHRDTHTHRIRKHTCVT